MKRILVHALFAAVVVANQSIAASISTSVITPKSIVGVRGTSVDSPFGADVTIQNTLPASMSNRGDVLFEAIVKGSNITSSARDRALLTYREGSLDTVAHLGEILPGSTMPLRSFENLGIVDDNGLVSFRGRASNNTGINAPFENSLWVESVAGTLSEAIGARFANGQITEGERIDYHIHGRDGDLVAISQDSTSNSNQGNPIGVYYGGAFGLTLRVQKGDSANGLDGPNVFQTFSSPSVNANGDFTFHATHPPDFGVSVSNSGVWGGSSISGISQIAISGTPANELTLGAIYGSLGQVVSNNNEDLVFQGSFRAPTPSGLELQAGVYLQREDEIREMWPIDKDISVNGEVLKVERVNGLIVNGHGDVASYVTEKDSESQQEFSSIYRRDFDGDLVRVLRSGDAAIGLEDGVTFQDFRDTNTSVPRDGLFMNIKGDLVIRAVLDGPGITDSNDEVVYLSTSAGELIPIIREGDLIDVSTIDGLIDARTVTGFSWVQNNFFGSAGGSGGEDGRRSPLNDLGQFVLDVTYTSGEGVFILDLPTAVIPEPSTIALTILGLFMAMHRRR